MSFWGKIPPESLPTPLESHVELVPGRFWGEEGVSNSWNLYLKVPGMDGREVAGYNVNNYKFYTFHKDM